MPKFFNSNSSLCLNVNNDPGVIPGMELPGYGNNVNENKQINDEFQLGANFFYDVAAITSLCA